MIKELKDVFQPILHFKGLIRELSEEFWPELSQKGDHRAQTLAFYFLSLTAVIKELMDWFWSTMIQSSDQSAQEEIDLSNSSFSSNHSAQAFIFLLTVSQCTAVISELRKELTFNSISDQESESSTNDISHLWHTKNIWYGSFVEE